MQPVNSSRDPWEVISAKISPLCLNWRRGVSANGGACFEYVSGEKMCGVCGVRCFESIMLGKHKWGKEMREMLRKVDRERHMTRCLERHN